MENLREAAYLALCLQPQAKAKNGGGGKEGKNSAGFWLPAKTDAFLDLSHIWTRNKKNKVVSEGGANTWQWVPVITAVREQASERGRDRRGCLLSDP